MMGALIWFDVRLVQQEKSRMRSHVHSLIKNDLIITFSND